MNLKLPSERSWIGRDRVKVEAEGIHRRESECDYWHEASESSATVVQMMMMRSLNEVEEGKEGRKNEKRKAMERKKEREKLNCVHFFKVPGYLRSRDAHTSLAPKLLCSHIRVAWPSLLLDHHSMYKQVNGENPHFAFTSVDLFRVIFLSFQLTHWT